MNINFFINSMLYPEIKLLQMRLVYRAQKPKYNQQTYKGFRVLGFGQKSHLQSFAQEQEAEHGTELTEGTERLLRTRSSCLINNQNLPINLLQDLHVLDS
jgi:hypothetical protein